MRCLVVGARGFVGSSLVRQLVDRGHRVTALEVRPAADPRETDDRVDWRIGDCGNPDAVRRAIGPEGVDTIYYGPFFRTRPGAADLGAEWAVMGGGALNVFNLVRSLDIKRVVFPSSTAVHGAQPQDGEKLHEASPVAPFMVYGATKLVCEYFGRRINDEIGENRIISVRLPSVYGPGAAVASRGVNIFPVQAARGLRGAVDYLANVRVCIAHVEDTARFLADLMTTDGCAHDLYELGGLDVSFGDIADAVRRVIPGASLSFGEAASSPLPHAVSNDRAAREFGLTHRPLDAGVTSIIAHERRVIASRS